MASLFPRFERVDVEYKALNGTSFPAAILVPKNLILNTVSRSCPLLVHFHGGGLYVGTNLDPFFLSKWFCPQHQAQLFHLHLFKASVS